MRREERGEIKVKEVGERMEISGRKERMGVGR